MLEEQFEVHVDAHIRIMGIPERDLLVGEINRFNRKAMGATYFVPEIQEFVLCYRLLGESGHNIPVRIVGIPLECF
ncbi:MAG TPA: hypothetical protein V6C52_09565 [Coleofasciculaceae cyanobacterium]|jgi:hypothetical protein